MGMKISTLLFLFFITSATVFSQSVEEIAELSFDEIRELIVEDPSDDNKVLAASNAYILKAQLLDDKSNEWLGMEAILLHYYEQRRTAEAYEAFLELVAFAQKNKLPSKITRAYLNGGDIQMQVPNIKKALEYYNEALKYAKENSDVIDEQVALNRIADLHTLVDDYENALLVKKQSIAIFEEIPTDSTFTEETKNISLAYLHYSVTNLYRKLNKIDSATIYLEKIRQFTKDLDSCFKREYFYEKGEIAIVEKRYEDAKNDFSSAYELCPTTAGELAAMRKAYRFGRIAIKQESYDEAQRVLAQGLRDYEVSAEEEAYMRDYYKLLAEANKQTGNFEQASYYFEKYLNTKSEYAKIEQDLTAAEKQKELQKFQKDIAVLKAEKEQKQSYLNYLLLAGLVLILLLLFLLLKFYQNKKKNEARFNALLEKIKAAESPEQIIDSKDAVLDETNTTDVPEETKQQILEGLKKLEAKEYFLQQECNSYNVAKKINTNTSYLSKVINSHYGKNFNTYINDLRINYAIVRLKNDVIFRSYSIQSIAEELGYKTADSFTKYFKKDTGLNPSFYIKEIKNIA